jgi:hypothetical protein
MEQQQKQEYLIKEIINKGHDKRVFSDFLKQHYPNKGVDVNLYTYQQLNQAVEEFKMKIKF